jgi:hypothetical protein
VVSVTLQPFCIPGETSVPIEMEAGGPYGGSAIFGRMKNSPPIGIRNPVRPATSLVAYHTGTENVRNEGFLGAITLQQILEKYDMR